MTQLIGAVAPTLFAIACIYAVWAALDFGRRWVALRDKTRETNEALEAVKEHQRAEMAKFEIALDQSLKAIQELEDRIRDLERDKEANAVALGIGRRPRAPVPLTTEG